MRTRPDTPTRPISIAHLVFGLVFAGIAIIWLVGELTDVEAPGFALWGPAVLIGAGVVGLIASFAGTWRRSRPTQPVEPVPTVGPEGEPTTVLPDLDAESTESTHTQTVEDSEEER